MTSFSIQENYNVMGEIMKRKEVDVFAILIGIVIGFLFGYFLSLRINDGKIKEVVTDEPSYGNVYMLQILKANNIEDIHNVLSDAEYPYEIIKVGTTFYVYGYISNELSVIEVKKEEFEELGFTPTIKLEYILDWPNYYLDLQEKHDFYLHAVKNLLNSVEDDKIVIEEKYYQNPVDLEVFSNLTLLQSIKNPEIKVQIQLELYRMLYEELN